MIQQSKKIARDNAKEYYFGKFKVEWIFQTLPYHMRLLILEIGSEFLVASQNERKMKRKEVTDYRQLIRQNWGYFKHDPSRKLFLIVRLGYLNHEAYYSENQRWPFHIGMFGSGNRAQVTSPLYEECGVGGISTPHLEELWISFDVTSADEWRISKEDVGRLLPKNLKNIHTFGMFCSMFLPVSGSVWSCLEIFGRYDIRRVRLGLYGGVVDVQCKDGVDPVSTSSLSFRKCFPKVTDVSISQILDTQIHTLPESLIKLVLHGSPPYNRNKRKFPENLTQHKFAKLEKLVIVNYEFSDLTLFETFCMKNLLHAKFECCDFSSNFFFDELSKSATKLKTLIVLSKKRFSNFRIHQCLNYRGNFEKTEEGKRVSPKLNTNMRAPDLLYLNSLTTLNMRYANFPHGCMWGEGFGNISNLGLHDCTVKEDDFRKIQKDLLLLHTLDLTQCKLFLRTRSGKSIEDSEEGELELAFPRGLRRLSMDYVRLYIENKKDVRTFVKKDLKALFGGLIEFSMGSVHIFNGTEAWPSRLVEDSTDEMDEQWHAEYREWENGMVKRQSLIQISILMYAVPSTLQKLKLWSKDDIKTELFAGDGAELLPAKFYHEKICDLDKLPCIASLRELRILDCWKIDMIHQELIEKDYSKFESLEYLRIEEQALKGERDLDKIEKIIHKTLPNKSCIVLVRADRMRCDVLPE